MRRGAEVSVDAVFLRELWRSSHTCSLKCVLKNVLELWTVKMSQRFIWSLTEELMLACESSCQQQRSYKDLKKKKSLTSLHELMRSDQDNGKKKPTENNQSTSIFS